MLHNKVITMPVRGLVLFPNIEVSFDVGSEQATAAVMAADNKKDYIFIVTQKNKDRAPENLNINDVYNVGVYAKIVQVKRLKKDLPLTVTIMPICRANILSFAESDKKYYVSDIETHKTTLCDRDTKIALLNTIEDKLGEFLAVTAQSRLDNVPSELVFPTNLSKYCDFIAFTIFRETVIRQRVLELYDVEQRAKFVLQNLDASIRVFKLEQEIESEVQSAADRSQEEFYLHEKFKAIKRKLGMSDMGSSDDEVDEVSELKKKIEALPIDQKNKDMLLKELKKLNRIQPGSPDANVIQTYLDEVLAFPWGKYSASIPEVASVKSIIESDHYGLDKIKQRFIELAAVRKHTDDPGAQVICLVGPPGVGKTSIVSSVASAMKRKYVRLSLGGVHDEAEIRGHRKTYIGAMPGRIVSAIKQAGVMNPVILLDEIDKLANDGRGDPSSAMLEVLDPAQNSTFRDNFIGIPIDLSKVIFVTTANDPSQIPGPLYDRMEIIEVPGYTFEEKFQIAKKHLIKKQRKNHKLTASQLKVPDAALKYLINFYTKEAGVRRLEQLISAICRKALVELDSGEVKSINVNVNKLKAYLGPERFKDDDVEKEDVVGVINGLAWTAAGGEMLQIEAITMPGSGKTEVTGNLGDVMKESAKAAISYIRANADKYDVSKEMFEKRDIHIHAPQGAVPKDGPSAGVTISTAILSALTGRSFNHEVAMTGEISLTGRVMPIGGLREKSMAAYKNGIKKVIIPYGNIADLEEVHQTVKDNVKFIPVKKLDEVFEISLNK